MHKLRLVFALAAFGLAATSSEAAPPPAGPLSVTQIGDQLYKGKHMVHYPYPYCRRWHWRCAERWGWHTRRFHKCLWRHGC
jgi:hypothetical protein